MKFLRPAVFRRYLPVLLAGIMLCSCGKSESDEPIPREECDGPHLNGSDCSILSFSLSDGGDPIAVNIYEESLVAVLDYNFDFASTTAEFALSEGAAIAPDPSSVTDWSADREFTVTGFDGKSSKTYRYTVEFDYLESYCRENKYFTAQEELDEFGSRGYTRVRSIVVNGSDASPITDLSPLGSLKVIDNNLTIKGFQGEEIILDGLTALSSFDMGAGSVKRIGLNSLTEIGNLMIGCINEEQYNPPRITLESLGFDKLTVVYNNLVFNFSFAEGFDMDCLPALTSVGGDVNIVGTNVSFLSSLTSVGSISVQGFFLESLEGLQNVREVSGTVRISGQRLATLSPFRPEKLGALYINNAPVLTSLEGLENVSEATSVNLSGLQKLTNLDGLGGLRTIRDELYIQRCGLTDLNAFENLEHVGKSVSILNNRALEDFGGLKKCLADFTGTWNVSGNKSNPTVEDILEGD